MHIWYLFFFQSLLKLLGWLGVSPLNGKTLLKTTSYIQGQDPSTRTKAKFDARSAIPVIDGTQIRLQSPGTNELDFVQ